MLLKKRNGALYAPLGPPGEPLDEGNEWAAQRLLQNTPSIWPLLAPRWQEKGPQLPSAIRIWHLLAPEWLATTDCKMHPQSGLPTLGTCPDWAVTRRRAAGRHSNTHTHAQQQGFPPARAGADNGSGDNSCPTAVDPAPADRVPGRETLPGHDTHNSNGWVLLLELTTAAAAAVQRRSAVLPTHPSPSPRHVSRSAPAERRRATVAHGKHTAARAGLLLELATAAAGARRGPAIALR